ncbi:CCA tRNA nucleotidyltransferase [Labrys wisconsinensis]|uniref:Poly(A) polymerase n=1 Tax=Labrys wisconsinensis TaxID=425677 RepID=A0ABU0JH49_9HYPH|nr:CCA tRNA nucleotidyltransferase [Labrys wisconsinensis]MDQ0473621.1 poly(A) polymerase [Labrys wisconsinensis]
MTPRFPWLAQPPLSTVLAALDHDGEEARVVGGAVRNALLDEQVADWDIATTATPDVVVQRCTAAHWKVVPTGIDHGTVTVIAGGQAFEVTTLRQDVETDGRHAVVRFGRDFAADALRRDFTINALSLSREGTVHDYAGGLADIAARRVRFIGDADRRIAEDYLRILRLFRFHARFGEGPVDATAMAAAVRGRGGLALLSRERVRAELIKLLLAPGAGDVLAEMDGAGFLLALFGGVARVAAFRRLAALEAARGLAPDPVRRLGALALFVREDAARLAERLRLANAEARRLEVMAATGERLRAPLAGKPARDLLYRLREADFRDAVLLAWARSGDAGWRPVLDLAEAWPPPKSPFSGARAARLGVAPGPRLGRVLQEAERRWIDADYPADAEAWERILRAAIDATA